MSSMDAKKITELQKLLVGIYSVLEINKGTTLPVDQGWKVDSEPLGRKIACHGFTVFYLIPGTKPTIAGINSTINFTDYLSIFAIVRSALEAYLTFFYVFIDENVSEEEKHFRYELWQLSSLSQRQRHTIISELARTQLSKEKTDLKERLTKLGKSVYFHGSSLSTKSQNMIKENKPFDWKPRGGWATIAQKTGMSERLFDDMYNHLSSVSHSDGVVVWQMNRNDPKATQHGMSGTAVTFLNIVLSYFINDYAKLFPKVRERINDKLDLIITITVNIGVSKDYPKTIEKYMEKNQVKQPE